MGENQTILQNLILNDLYQYCKANRLVINYDKCRYIEFSSSPSDTSLEIGIHENHFEQVDRSYNKYQLVMGWSY